MSNLVDQLFAVYKVSIYNIRVCVQQQTNVINEASVSLTNQAIGKATAAEPRVLQSLNCNTLRRLDLANSDRLLGNSGEIEESRALMESELVSLLEVIETRYQAFDEKFFHMTLEVQTI